MDYYDSTSLYYGLNQKYKHTLQTAQNKIARYILSLSSRDHIGHVGQTELNLLKFSEI